MPVQSYNVMHIKVKILPDIYGRAKMLNVIWVRVNYTVYSLSLYLARACTHDRNAERNYYICGCVSFFRLTRSKKGGYIRRPVGAHTCHSRHLLFFARECTILFYLPFSVSSVSSIHRIYGNIFVPIFLPEIFQQLEKSVSNKRSPSDDRKIDFSLLLLKKC